MKKALIFALIVMILPVLAVAEDGVPVMTWLEQTTISGFVDASYSGNLDMKNNTFALDQGEIDLERSMEEVGIVLRVDFEWVNNGVGGFSQGLEQGYMNYTLPFLPAVDFTFGKFNAPIGFELLDPNDMYQYSHSLIFDFALPTNLTGLMGNIQFARGIDLAVYAANGWDRNVDNNSTKTVGGRLGIARGNFAIGFSGIMGVPDVNQDLNRSVYDVDVTFMPMDNWLIGGEFNMGTIASSIDGVDDVSWTGFMVMTHFGFNDWLGLTGRYDSIDDADGAIFGIPVGMTEGLTRSSFTVAPTFMLGNGLGALVEYRMDMSSEDTFVDSEGEAIGSTSTVAFEMTYTF